jgi:hypothetical protein
MPTPSRSITPDEARAAVLAGKVVRSVTGVEYDDPVCLHYMDRTFEMDHEPMIYTEAIEGWSEGVNEAICEPGSDFYVEFVSDAHSLTITDQEPPQRETARV